VNQTSAIAAAIPEADYWLQGATIELSAVALNSAAGSQAVQAERQSGEGDEQSGWESLYVGTYRADSECLQWLVFGASRKSWKRHPDDTDGDRLDIETSRAWRIDTNPASQIGLGLWYTYHSITFSVAGDITGSNGGTVNLKLYKYGTKNIELLTTGSRVGNGSYSLTWHDNTDTLFVEAYEDGTHIGRSANSTASGSP
jgi:hypothetical protein